MSDRTPPLDALVEDRKLSAGDALRVVCFVLRHHASDAEIADTLKDDAAEFYGRLADADEQAARIVAAIERATGAQR